MDTIVIESIGQRISTATRAAIAEADVVTGVERGTEREYTVFGTPSMESTITLKHPSAMRMVRVNIDGSPAELDRLTRLVREVKGLGAGPRKPK